MKKLVFTLLALVYFFAVTGWQINIHYCMGRVDSVSLVTSHKDSCDTCGMTKTESEGCCHDENQFVRLAQDQKLPVSLHYQLVPPVPEIAVIIPPTIVSPILARNSSATWAGMDPPVAKTPVFILNRVFRI
ncbi:MAG: HYC_CC_PP family protein [Chitinophagaceae bacterium]